MPFFFHGNKETFESASEESEAESEAESASENEVNLDGTDYLPIEKELDEALVKGKQKLKKVTESVSKSGMG